MSVKWTGIHSDSGILRKSEFKEKKEELFVFGYSCKLFRDDDKALHIDQGKHLIPWMGDESLKIDRYDARGALHELATLEAPSGGFDWRVELTRGEQDVEQLCDEERYRALHTDEDEEEMYKEEELKRLHAAGYGQVGFNYEASAPPAEPPPQEVDEPFAPAPSFRALLPEDVIFPETQKQNAIIEKTAKFIANQGTQMEILIKAKQGDNPQFQFLNKESTLNVYYRALIALVKADKWPEKPPEVVEEKQPEATEEYLHPSLASTVIESAPSIPSIAYRPSADCDYTLLVSRLRGSPSPSPPPPAHSTHPTPSTHHSRGTPPPPGTAPLALPPAHIVRAPVLIAQHTTTAESSQQVRGERQAAPAPAPAPAPAHRPAPAAPLVLSPAKSTGLSLMKNYNSDTGSDSESSDSFSNDCKGQFAGVPPPPEVQLVIDKMAAYVARNGDEFAEIVRAKSDPRFAFLEPAHAHHAYYRALMQRKRSAATNGTERGRSNAVVSFSIKKHKEPDPILPKPALPYESSSDDEFVNSQQDKPEETERKEVLKSNVPEVVSIGNMPPVIVYKLEGTHANNLPIVKSFEAIPIVKQMPKLASVVKQEIKELPKIIEKPAIIKETPIKVFPSVIEVVQEKTERIQCSQQKPENVKSRKTAKESSTSRDKRKYGRKREHKSKSESRESKRSERRSTDREKREKEHSTDKKKRKIRREELDNEIISLVDNSDDLIDLTGEQSDSKGGGAGEGAARPARPSGEASTGRRTEDFLRRAGLNPAASLPTSSLASAMVDTLETLRKKREEEEEKRRRREKRRRKDRREHEEECGPRRKSKRRKHKSSDDERSDCDGSKKKKRKKDKKHCSRDKKRRKDSEPEEDLMTINIDLTNTLKELRTASPTKELGLDRHADDAQPRLFRDESSEEGGEELAAVRGRRKNKREQREYSEGEWSSDSCEGIKTPDTKLDT